MKNTLIVIYSNDFDRRVKILKAMLMQKESVKNYSIAICNCITELANLMNQNNEDIAGVILDFEKESISDIRNFSYEVINTKESVVPLFVHTKEFGYEHTKFHLLKFVLMNKISTKTFDELLSKVPIFFNTCDLNHIKK